MKPFRVLSTLLIVAVASIAVGDADAATIVVSYERGHPDVLINGYRTQAMGTFRLADGDDRHLALCIEAHEPHSNRQDAYAPVDNNVRSSHLDTLLWLVDRSPELDDDVAVAAAALAWHYAEAQRSIGPLVWSDGNRGFDPIGPLQPEPWDALPPFSLDHMVGLRTGHTDLDHVETAVAVLHRRVEAMLGPWTLTGSDQRFLLTGPAGPIAGQPISVTVQRGADEPTTTVLTTDADGRVTPDVGHAPDGATVSAGADSPGVHREWDGDAAIQRMATATSNTLTAGFEVAPLPRHLHVQKTSTDPTIAPAGAKFELLDADGETVGTATSNADGIARFDPVDPSVHPGPYQLRETVAPPGLDRTAPDVTLTALSADPDDPTVIEMIDEPLTTPIVVRKQLSEPDLGPADRSGFVFAIARRGDDWTDELVTGTDGRSDPVDLALGTYDICERAVPPWAEVLGDGGCVEVTVDLDGLLDDTPIDVAYVNLAPTVGIDTVARDLADGDRRLPTTGGDVADRVQLTGLVPGTTYALVGSVVDVATGDEIATASTTFVADSDRRIVELEFSVPAVPPGALVITETLRVGDRVVATHRDLADPDQTLTVITPSTTTTTTTTTIRAPSTTVPPAPTSTTPSTPTSTATTTTTTTPPAATTTSVVSPPSRPVSPPTLPATGSDAAATLLRLADLGFVAGVALVALVSYAPRRNERSPTKL